MEKEIEEWRPVVGYEGLYEVSSLGRVKSLSRIKMINGKYPIMTKERILKPAINNNGYWVGVLCRDGKNKTVKIHSLMAIAFFDHSPCGHKLVINHKNLIRSDNRISNLEIITNRENCNRKHLKSSSKFVGVYWNSKNKKWISNISVGTKTHYIGSFCSEKDAHNAHEDALECVLNGKEIPFYQSEKQTSKHKYIHLDKKRGKWIVTIVINGKQKYFGSYLTEEQALLARNKKLKEIIL